MMKRIVGIVLVVLCIFALVACSGSGGETSAEPPASAEASAEASAPAETEGSAATESAAETEGETVLAEVIDTDMSVLQGLKVGYAQRNTNGAWLIAQTENLKKIAEQYGVEFIMTDADDDQNKQLSDVEDLCAQGIDILVYPPIEYEAGAAALDIAAQYGVPVMLLGNDCAKEDSQYVASMLFNYVMDGGACGEYVAENLDGAKIVEIQGILGSDPEIGRSEGFAAELEGTNCEIIVQQTANFLMDEAQEVMENILQSYDGQFDTVYCHTDEMALGVVAALKATGKEGTVNVLGIDGQKLAVQEIIDGNITAIATCDTQNGELLFSTIAAYLNGELENKDVTIPPEIIDASNAEEAMTNGMAF